MKFPVSELPRERLLRDGVDALSLQELVAILLGTGTQGKSVLILAQEMLLYFGGMDGLLNATIEELTQFKGVGKAKAILLKAAFGIALRAEKEKIQLNPKITTIEDAFAVARPQIGHLEKEALLVLLCDVKNRVIHQEIISLGTVSEVLVHPREVFQLAVRYGAMGIIVCHNHPSDDPSPSDADCALTKRLLKCSQIMSIRLIDHLIVTKKSFYSFRKKKHFLEKPRSVLTELRN